jgi:4-hydroxy-tetrahydrodipicolinate reductase
MISVLDQRIAVRWTRRLCSYPSADRRFFSAVAGVDPFDCSASYSCPVYKSLDEVQEKADVIIDFSVPATTPDILRYALEQKIPVVIGTTGLGERELKPSAPLRTPSRCFKRATCPSRQSPSASLYSSPPPTLAGNFDVEIIETAPSKKSGQPERHRADAGKRDRLHFAGGAKNSFSGA